MAGGSTLADRQAHWRVPVAPLTMRDLMTAPVITISPDASLGEAARLMLEKDVSCLPVVADDGKLIGIITHTDFTPRERHLPFSEESFYTVLGQWVSKESLEEEYHKLASRKVSEAMSHPVITVPEDAPLSAVAATMLREKVRRFPVVREGRLVGMVTRHDLIRIVATELARNAGATHPHEPEGQEA